MSAEYRATEQKLVETTHLVWRIENDRETHGTDEGRERAYAAAVGALHGYHFRDAELYHEERGPT